MRFALILLATVLGNLTILVVLGLKPAGIFLADISESLFRTLGYPRVVVAELFAYTIVSTPFSILCYELTARVMGMHPPGRETYCGDCGAVFRGLAKAACPECGEPL